MDRKKKLAAAIAAVQAFLEAEQQNPAEASAAPRRPNAWSMSGRLAQAQLDGLMQAKARR